MYSKSPKKSQELADIAENLKEVFIISKGENAAHLVAMVGDSTVTLMDRARVQGYLRKWTQGEMLVGCAMYVDMLQVPSVLSQSLQEDNIDIVQGIKQVLKAVSTLQSLAKNDAQLWPTAKLLLDRVIRKFTRGLLSRISQTACSPYAIIKPWQITRS